MDDLTDGQTDGGALRKQLEKALADLKSVNEAKAALESQLRAGSVKEMFAEIKADPRGVKFYTGEPTKEALAEWLKGDGEVFATAPATAPTTPAQTAPAGVPAPGVVPPPVTLPPGFTPEMWAAAQAVSGMVPGTPAAPTADLGALTDQLPGLSYTSPEDGAKVAAAFQGIRAQAAARLANGG